MEILMILVTLWESFLSATPEPQYLQTVCSEMGHQVATCWFEEIPTNAWRVHF